LSFLTDAVISAGYEPGEDIRFAIDAASSELYDPESGYYLFPGESKMKGKQVRRSSSEMIQYYKELTDQYPVFSIEDGLWEEDWEGWKMLTSAFGESVQLVGDDLFVTNTRRLKKGIDMGIANAILIKVNQIGTLTESLEAVQMAKELAEQGFGAIEVCGAFGEELARKMYEATGNKVSVGYIVCPPDQKELSDRFWQA
ncbi:MAG: hypothetical protein KHY90_10735, partial [Clostridium sp.]|nr:hypothetical protein [Clostridium sp.]